MKYLPKQDKEITTLIKAEEKRLQNTLMMIPSENIASKAVEEAVGSSLAEKYAEGYQYRRYYQGQEVVDKLEELVVERVKKLFGVPYANVQPYSGSPANLAAEAAILEPGDTFMGLSLAFGGHLTHGADASLTSKFFRSVQYELGKDGYIDYDALLKLAKKEKPKLIIAGTTAYPRVLDWKKFREVADAVGAYLMADVAHISGLIVGGAYPSPVKYVDVVTTTTHKTLRGPRGAIIMVTERGLKKDPELAKKVAKSVFPGLQGGPHMNSIAGIGVAVKEATTKRFQTYAAQVVKNAKALAEGLKKYDFNLISGGTDSHLILMDISNKNLLGNTVAEGFEAAGMIVNRNSVPYDKNPPFYPSGIRLGTPGITSRGMKEREMKTIAGWMHEVTMDLAQIKASLKITMEMEKKRETREKIISRSSVVRRVKNEVKKLCAQFPIKPTY